MRYGFYRCFLFRITTKFSHGSSREVFEVPSSSLSTPSTRWGWLLFLIAVNFAVSCTNPVSWVVEILHGQSPVKHDPSAAICNGFGIPVTASGWRAKLSAGCQRVSGRNADPSPSFGYCRRTRRRRTRNQAGRCTSFGRYFPPLTLFITDPQ